MSTSAWGIGIRNFLRVVTSLFLILQSLFLFQAGLIAELTPSVGAPSLALIWEYGIVPIILLCIVTIFSTNSMLRRISIAVIMLEIVGLIYLASNW